MLGLTLAAALAAQAAGGGWTWTLYENDDSIVLANEVPDTTRLRAVLECEPHSGVARVTVYRAQAEAGAFVTLTSGDASAAVEAVANGRNGDSRLSVPLRLDHPVFDAFHSSGRLSVRAGDLSRDVRVEPVHRAKLRQFASLCS